MNVAQYAKQMLGKAVDVDGYYGAQCWDGVAHYAKKVWNIPTVSTNGSGAAAGQIRPNGTLGQNAKHFDLIPKGEIPQPGDIFVMGYTIGKYGHTGVVLQADANGFTSMDQNVGCGGKGCAFKRLSWPYRHVTGYLRPKKAKKTTPVKTVARPPVSIPRKAPSWVANLVPKGLVKDNKDGTYTYAVQKGDTLWVIAQKFFNDGAQWPKLGYTGDPRKLSVGTKLHWGEIGRGDAEDLSDQMPSTKEKDVKVEESKTKVMESGDDSDDILIMGDSIVDVKGKYTQPLEDVFENVISYLGDEKTKEKAGGIGLQLAKNVDKLGVPTHIAFYGLVAVAVYSNEIQILETVSTFALGSRAVQDATKGATAQRKGKPWYKSRKLGYMIIGVVAAQFYFMNVESATLIMQTYFGSAMLSGGATILGKKLDKEN